MAPGALAKAADLMAHSAKLSRQFFGDTTSVADTENKLGRLALEQGHVEEANLYLWAAAENKRPHRAPRRH